jgi:lipoate-protein ligase B
MVQRLQVHHLGLMPYAEAHALQQRLREERIANRIPDTLLLLEHPPVITLGRAFRPDHLLVDEATLGTKGIEVVITERGGSATYHGPGQIVAYVILDLQALGLGLHTYLRLLEETMLVTLADFGIKANRDSRNAGVWVGDAKIGFVGLHVRRWVTIHGCALNVDVDLTPFDRILPCGLEGVSATSMASILGSPVNIDAVKERIGRHLGALLRSEVRVFDPQVTTPQL